MSNTATKVFVLATGDATANVPGLGTMTTMDGPAIPTVLPCDASFLSSPAGLVSVFYGPNPVYNLPLPEDATAAVYSGAPKLRYDWRSKKFVFPGQITMGAAKVVQEKGGGVRFRLWVDLCCVYETVVRGCVPFRLPAQIRGITWEIELLGCSRVTEVRLAPTIRELMGNE
jgi:hypothetical protein